MMQKNTTIQPLHSLAWQIWSAEGKPVVIEDPAALAGLESAFRDGIVQKTESGHQFTDARQLALNTAHYILQNERTQLIHSPGACFRRLDEIYGKEIEKDHKVSAHVLALIHNGNHIDAYAWARKAIDVGVRLYDVLHILEDAADHFEHAVPETIFQFFGNEKLKHGITGSAIYVTLKSWFSRYPEIAGEIKRLHEENPSNRNFSLYISSLHGLIDLDFEKGFRSTILATKASHTDISGAAIHTLRLLDYSHPSRRQSLNETINICSDIIRIPGHPLFATAAATLTPLIAYDEKKIAGLMDEIGKMGTEEALRVLSLFLVNCKKPQGDTEWFQKLLLSHLTAAKDKSTLSIVDDVLEKWARDSVKSTRAIEFINTWISRQPDEAMEEGIETVFSSTLHKLANLPGVLSRILTEWLLNDGARFTWAARALISRLHIEGVKNFEFSLEIIDNLSKDEIRFLIRRVLGYFHQEGVVIPLIFSLARTQNAKSRTFGIVAAALSDHVGYDYPHQTLEYLENIQKNETETQEIKGFCADVHARLKERMDALNSLANLKEFHCSSTKVKAQHFAKERYRQINKAMEEASEKSIWRQIASEIHIKGGLSTFNSMHGGGFSHSGEFQGTSFKTAIPLSEISDPVGAARQRLLFRRAKKGDA